MVSNTVTQARNAMLQDSHAKGCFTWSHSQQHNRFMYRQQHVVFLITYSAVPCVLRTCSNILVIRQQTLLRYVCSFQSHNIYFVLKTFILQRKSKLRNAWGQ